MKKRAKVMLPTIRELITKRALQDNANRNELADKLIETIKELFPKQTPPQFETVIKMISAARNHETLPEDKPWDISSTNEYPLHPLAIAIIFELKAKGYDYLSIRTAVWISRLCQLPNLSITMLYAIAFIYAQGELLTIIAKTDFDTSGIDRWVIECITTPEGMTDLGRGDDSTHDEEDAEGYFNARRKKLSEVKDNE